MVGVLDTDGMGTLDGVRIVIVVGLVLTSMEAGLWQK